MSPARSSRVTWVLIVVGGSLAVGLTVAVSPLVAVGVAAVTLVVPFVLRYPEYSGMALLGWGVLRYPFVKTLGVSGALMAVVELLALILLLGVAFQRRRRSWILSQPFALGALASFVGIAIVSWAVNGGTLLQLIFGLRGYLFVPALGVTLGMLLSTEKDYAQLLRLGVWLSLLQIPFAAFQYFFGGGRSIDVDRVVGTLGPGGANVLGVWMLGALLGALVIFFRRPSLATVAAAVGFTSVIVWSSARLALWLAPVIVVTALLTARRRSGGSFAAGVGLVLVVSLLMWGWVSYAYQFNRGDLSRDVQLVRLIEDQTQIQAGRVPRLGYVLYGVDFVKQNARVPLLGTGPASAASGAAATLKTQEVDSFSTGMRLEAAGTVAKLQPGVSYTLPLPTQLASMLVEYGPLGLASYLAFIVAVSLAAMRSASHLRERKAFLFTLLVFFALFATFGSVYAVIWESYSLIGMALWWCVVLVMGFSGVESAGPPAVEEG